MLASFRSVVVKKYCLIALLMVLCNWNCHMTDKSRSSGASRKSRSCGFLYMIISATLAIQLLSNLSICNNLSSPSLAVFFYYLHPRSSQPAAIDY